MRIASRTRPEGRIGQSSRLVTFVWPDVDTATSYVLQVGTFTGASDRYNANVGNVLLTGLVLDPGTYYSRVVPYAGDTPMTPMDEQRVTV